MDIPIGKCKLALRTQRWERAPATNPASPTSPERYIAWASARDSVPDRWDRYEKAITVTDRAQNIEIERKFLVAGDGWRGHEGTRYRQGYLAISASATVRVRVGGGTAFVTIKGPTALGTLGRIEYEYPIPPSHAEHMIEMMCDGHVVEKTRYRISDGSSIWEVDEFHGRHSGLVIAEIELATAEQAFSKPAWVGDEVTHDYRYSSAWLAQQP